MTGQSGQRLLNALIRRPRPYRDKRLARSMSGNNPKPKRISKRYLTRLFWDALCRVLPFLRRRLYFYDRSVGTDSIGVAPLLIRETEHDLNRAGMTFTKEEKAF